MSVTTRIRVTAAAMILAGLVGAPAAGAAELPPPPVEPGYENVVITARPLSHPARSAEVTAPSVPTASKTATAKTAKKTTAKVKAKKASAKVVKKTSRVTKSTKRR